MTASLRYSVTTISSSVTTAAASTSPTPSRADNSGNFGFNPSDSTYSTGDGALDFLLGIPGTYAQGSGASIQADAFLNYVYAQDSWKVSPTFTVDYGLSYSIDTPIHNNQYLGEAVPA